MSRALKVKKIKGFDLPEAVGEHYRLTCLTGENKGISYFLKADRVVMGRSEKSDIKVLDAKSSREHVELVRLEKNYVLTDLGSHNGVFVNDIKVKQHKLKDGDRVVIGKTVYKYTFVKVEKKISLVEDELNFNDNNNDNDEDNGDNSISSDSKGKKKKNILLIIVGLTFLMFLLPDDENKKTNKKKVEVKRDGLDFSTVSSRSSVLNEATALKVESHIHRGLREHREGNYFRALEEFNMATVLDPFNGRVQFYIKRSKQRLNELAERSNERAKVQEDSFKLDAAKLTYCETIRLLRNDPSNTNYINALESIKNLEVKMGYESGAIKCLEK